MPSANTKGPLYTHFEKLPETHTQAHTRARALNLLLGGKAITTADFRPHPPPGQVLEWGRPFCWRVLATTWLTWASLWLETLTDGTQRHGLPPPNAPTSLR